MQDALLSATSIVKYFHDPQTFRVLDGISIEVFRGEFLSIVGKSGSGKTTLLYVLSTMDTDFEGHVDIDGVALNGMKRRALAAFRNEHIGFVFQFHYLLPEFTALENVMLPAMKLGKRSNEEIRARALELLDAVELRSHAEKRATQLSGGEQQRVAIARSLINDPAVVMGDEPTGNLDSKNTQMVFEILAELTRSRGQTIVTVTHDTEFSARSDRIIELADGRVVS
ncbi:MAG: ABC transporter ATP-binding protein [Myxococcota bacterium]